MNKILLSSVLFFQVFFGFSQTLTLQPGAEGKDSRIWSKPDKQNSTAGDIPYMTAAAWTWDGVYGEMRMLVDFDLSALPANAVITDAKLSLYDFSEGFEMANGDNALFIKRITSPWEESEVTWNNKPATTEINKVSHASFPTGEDLSDVDVTDLVADMVSNKSTSHGFLIMLQNESIFRTFNAATSDWKDSSMHPKLVINYTVPCITLQPGAEGKDSRIWSKADMRDSNAGDIPYMTAAAWTWDGLFGVMQMLIDFDLSSLPENALISHAGLSLYNFSEGLDMDNGDNALYIKRITSPWQESTVTWNNKPATTETNMVSHPSFASGDDLNVCVTDLVVDMLSNKSTSHGFLVMLHEESNYRTFSAATSDYKYASMHPKLEVCFTSPVLTGNPIHATTNSAFGLNVFPNPVSENSSINFNLREENNVLVEVLSSDGNLVKTVVNNSFPQGEHNVSLELESENLIPGLYLVRMVSGNMIDTKKIILK